MSLIDKISKLRTTDLADVHCESCIFKVVPFQEDPCLTCRYGKFGGKDKHYVKDESEES